MKKGVDYIGVSAGAMIINGKGELFLAKKESAGNSMKEVVGKRQEGAWNWGKP